MRLKKLVDDNNRGPGYLWTEGAVCRVQEGSEV